MGNQNKIIIFGIFSLIIYSGWYLKRIKTNSEIIQKNKETIEQKIFNIDSANRGYSDEVNNLMEEDLKLINNDTKIKILFPLYEKEHRKLAISKNEKEFKERFIRLGKIEWCINSILIEKYPSINLKHFLHYEHSNEGKKIVELINLLSDKFTKNYNIKQNMDLISPETSDNDCEGLLHE